MIRVYSKTPRVFGSVKLILNLNDIIKVTLINDDNSEFIGDQLIQYVNLPKEDKFVTASNGVVTGRHQLGKEVWCKVTFRKPGRFTFKIFIESDNNSVYTIGEENRNQNFTYKKEYDFTMTAIAENNNEVIINGSNLFLSQAGGNTYTLKAECNNRGKITCNTKIFTKRMLFYSEVKMENHTSTGYLSTITDNLDHFKNELKNQHIELIKSFETSVKYMPNIERDTQYAFKADVETAYTNNPNNKNLDPYCTVITYTNQLAIKELFTEKISNITVGPGKKPILIQIEHNNDISTLWHRIEYPHDINCNEWYKSCTYTMTEIVNGIEKSIGCPIVIPSDKCTAIPFEDNSNYYTEVSIDVSHLRSLGTGKISFEAYIITSMRGGVSFKKSNIICICTKLWWENTSFNRQNNTIIHEVGHQLGMVPDGTSLDIGANHYTNRGHNGNHCHAGIDASIVTDYTFDQSSTATCIMHGSGDRIGINFCPDCASKVKKTDISDGIKIW